MAIAPNAQVFLFLSRILGKRIMDSTGRVQGKILDLGVAVADLYPPVTSILYQPAGSKTLVRLPWSRTAWSENQVIISAPADPADKIPGEGELLL